LGKILAGLSPVCPRLQAGRDDDEFLAVLDMAFAILLHSDRIGALGHDRPREDAHGAADAMRSRGGVPGGNPRRDRKKAPGRAVISMGEGITVDGGIIGGRDISGADDCFCKDAASGSGQRYGLGIDDAADPLAQDGERFVMPQPLAVGQEAVVEEPPLRHPAVSERAGPR
jgi:hypothetical protein